jgi:hypothetical protein
MSSGFDDHDDQGYDDRDERPERDAGAVIARARARVSTPGTMLVVAGLVGLLFSVIAIGVMVAAPTVMYDFFVNMIKNQPQNQQQQKQLKDMEAQKDAMRLDSPVNIASTGVGIVLNLLTVIGGLKMRSLSGYGLAMTGAIVGIIPAGGCCCLTLPIGIWALIVLANPDVKAGFEAVRSGAADRY